MCHFPIVVSVAAQVNAPCDAVWNVISDIENAPSFVTQVQSIERLSSDAGCFCEGTRWREVRTCGKYNMVQLKTVTCIRKEKGGGKSVLINVSFPGEEKKELTNTCTLQVRPRDGDKNKCVLFGSFGAMAGGVKWRLYFFFCGRRLVKRGGAFMLEELEEIRKEAEKRSHNQ
jgi:uncharacterized membrane protein